MLTMDIDQLKTQFTQNAYSNQRTIDTANILAVHKNVPLNNGFTVVFYTVLGKPS